MSEEFEINSNDIDNLDTKKKKNKVEKEEDIFSQINSQKALSEQLRKNLSKKFVLIVFIIPLSIMMGIVIIKTMFRIQGNNEREKMELVKDANASAKLNLQINKSFQWRTIKDQQITTIVDNVKSMKKELKGDINNTVVTIQKQNIQMAKTYDKKIKDIKTLIISSNNNVQKQIQILVENKDDYKKAIKHQNDIFEKKLKNVVGKKNSYSLPILPPLKNTKNFNSTSKDNGVSKGVNNNTSIAANDDKSKDSHEEDIVVPKKVFETVEEAIEVENSTYSFELQNEQTLEDTNENNTSAIKFTMMPGFAKGILINGGKIPVSFDGTSEASPVFIRITGDQLIANDANINIDGCIIIATAKADLSKQGVDLRLSKLSCNLTDNDGKHFKINQDVQGWVFSETGDYGIPGRLISRESDILKAGIPLTLVEGMVNTLSNVVSMQTSSGVSTGSMVLTPSQSVTQGMTAGVTTGSQNVLKKFSDYYLKILDSLTPVISIRAGREVVIAFKGGEEISVSEYEQLNTGYFDTINNDGGSNNGDW